MTQRAQRLVALDVLRGLIMVLMALDHVVAFVYRYHPSEVWAGAWTRYGRWEPFVTRLVTHLCAPGFFLLMGAGIALFLEARREQGWTDSQARGFLWKRGLLLLIINQLIENRAWTLGFMLSQAPPPAVPDGPWPGTPGPMTFVFSVLSGLGMALILSSLLLTLRTRWLAVLGTVIIAASVVLRLTRLTLATLANAAIPGRGAWASCISPARASVRLAPVIADTSPIKPKAARSRYASAPAPFGSTWNPCSASASTNNQVNPAAESSL